jgi:2',3'-cyclic-nucleotide 2'-phosphodiesterase (5'-nucleotidase family)
MKRLVGLAIAMVALAASSFGHIAEDGPDVGAHSASQSAADMIREAAGSDGAFLAAGILKPKSLQKDNLATLLQYPTNTIVVLSLTGTQIREAFERSVSMYPQPNEGFLQISGFEVTFKKSGAPNSRITNILVNGAKLEDTKSYEVAMPSSLAHGGLGYFKIWENAKTVKTFDKSTLEQILKGKKGSDSPPRWSAAS